MKDADGIQVLVENAAYPVNLIEAPEKTPAIDLPPVDSMHLIKMGYQFVIIDYLSKLCSVTVTGPLQ